MFLAFLSFVLAFTGAGTCEQQPASLAAVSARARDRTLPAPEREKAYENAISQCPRDLELYRELVSLLLENRQFDIALAWTEKGLAIAPSDSDLRIARAMALLPLGRARDALDALGSIETGQSCFYKGLAYRQLKDRSQSRACFEAAWKLGYQDAYVLYSIIQDDYELGHKQDGLEHFQLLLRMYPNSAWEHLLLADAYFAKENNDGARNEYLQALKMKPDLLEANFRLGYIAFQNGDDDSATRYFRKEIEVNPAYVDAHMFLAESLLHEDRKDEALTQLRQALALDPSSKLVFKRLATTLTEMDHLDEAKLTLENAAKRFPADPAFPAQLARVLTLLHDPRGAQEQAARARELTAQQHRKQEIVPEK